MSDFSPEEMNELHLKLGILGAIDVGIVVIDRAFEISMWNDFMANHSGKRPSQVRGRSLFEVAPEIEPDWFRRKAERAFELASRSFIIWEQRPYLFRFPQYRPVTGTSPFMYQNVTLLPLHDTRGRVERLGIIVYDVTDTAESARQVAQVKKAAQSTPPQWKEF